MTATCDECGREFKNERGVTIHKANTHEKKRKERRWKPPRSVSAKKLVPPIVSYDVEAGIEQAEAFFEKAENAETEKMRTIMMRRGRMELRAVKNRV